ncbi:MAG: sel1 repeat family protein [Gammaproteobacteria bacterium]|nr:sel1 repeat family protein [Gammaproteobacteria bacterium]
MPAQSLRKHPRAAPAFAVLLLSTAVSPVNADFTTAKRALDAGDYATALGHLQVDARQGHASALFELGRLYENGLGVPRSSDTAAVLYRVAWLQGSAQAEAALNRIANTMAGGQIVSAMQNAAQLQNSGRFVPALPGAPPARPAPPVAEAPVAPASPKPAPTAPAKPAPAPAPTAAPAVAGAGSRFDFKYTCAMQLKYQDKGSGGRYDMALYQPQPEPGYFMLGGVAQNNYDAPNGCALTIKPLDGAAAALLAPPSGWERVWRDKGTGATMDGSIWRGVPRSSEYVCLGHIGQTGKKEQPYVENYACVKRCLVQMVAPANPLWTTEATGAAFPIEVYVLPRTNSFVAVPEGQRPAAFSDLDPDAGCP